VGASVGGVVGGLIVGAVLMCGMTFLRYWKACQSLDFLFVEALVVKSDETRAQVLWTRKYHELDQGSTEAG